MSEPPVSPRWRILLTPRWLSWHLFALVAVAGMCWLGQWQFRRAMAGNTLSWAYTFEWPIFAIFGIVFWVKTIKDELRPAPEKQPAQIALPDRSVIADRQHGAISADATASRAGSPLTADAAATSAAEAGDVELAEYNAYLARLSSEVKGHGKWHGLR
jgi:hypothetical protein